MNVDVPLGLWLVALAATAFVTVIVCAGVLSSPERDAARRVVAVVLVWLAADAGLGLAGVFAASPDTRVPFIAAGIAVPLGIGVWLLGRPGSIQRLVDSIPLRRLIGMQLYRAAGVIFLIAWAAGRMPGAFALPAGIGDIAVGLGAPIVAARVRPRLDSAAPPGSDTPAGGPAERRADARVRRIAVAWNLAGITDLVVAVALGFLTSPSIYQLLASGDPNTLITRMPYVLIPTFAVPLSILLHVAALQRLGASASPTWGVAGTGVNAAHPWPAR